MAGHDLPQSPIGSSVFDPTPPSTPGAADDGDGWESELVQVPDLVAPLAMPAAAPEFVVPIGGEDVSNAALVAAPDPLAPIANRLQWRERLKSLESRVNMAPPSLDRVPIALPDFEVVAGSNLDGKCIFLEWCTHLTHRTARAVVVACRL